LRGGTVILPLSTAVGATAGAGSGVESAALRVRDRSPLGNPRSRDLSYSTGRHRLASAPSSLASVSRDERALRVVHRRGAPSGKAVEGKRALGRPQIAIGGGSCPGED